MIIIIITIMKKMSNTFEFKILENKDFDYPLPKKYERVKILYYNLIN